jgi:hypothetical protein
MPYTYTMQDGVQGDADTKEGAIEHLFIGFLFGADVYHTRVGDQVIDSPEYREPESRLMTKAEYVEFLLPLFFHHPVIPTGMNREEFESITRKMAPLIVEKTWDEIPTDEEYFNRYNRK